MDYWLGGHHGKSLAHLIVRHWNNKHWHDNFKTWVIPPNCFEWSSELLVYVQYTAKSMWTAALFLNCCHKVESNQFLLDVFVCCRIKVFLLLNLKRNHDNAPVHTWRHGVFLNVKEGSFEGCISGIQPHRPLLRFKCLESFKFHQGPSPIFQRSQCP